MELKLKRQASSHTKYYVSNFSLNKLHAEESFWMLATSREAENGFRVNLHLILDYTYFNFKKIYEII